ILHVDLARTQRGVLHLRRTRVRHRIAENTQANRRINVVCDPRPVFQIGKGVTFRSLLLVHQSCIAVIPSEVEAATQPAKSARPGFPSRWTTFSNAAGSFDSASLRSGRPAQSF